MTATFDLISEQVLSSAASSISFSNIPQGFKDLVLEWNARSSHTLNALNDLIIVFNNDTSAIYSSTGIWGDGSTAGSDRYSNQTSGRPGYWMATNQLTADQSILTPGWINIFSYANANVNKTYLSRTASQMSTNGLPNAIVGLWRSNSAITSIQLTTNRASNFVSGSTFRIYGIVG